MKSLSFTQNRFGLLNELQTGFSGFNRLFGAVKIGSALAPDTVVDRVVSAPWVSWGSEGATVAFDSLNRLHVVESTMDSTGHATIDLRFDSGSWTRRHLGPGSSYVSVAAGQGNRLVAVLVV